MGFIPLPEIEEALVSVVKMSRNAIPKKDGENRLPEGLAFGGQTADNGYAPYGAREIAKRAGIKITSIRDFIDLSKVKDPKKREKTYKQWEKMYGAVFTLGDKKHPGAQIVVPDRYLKDDNPSWGQFAITSHEAGHGKMMNAIPKPLQGLAMTMASTRGASLGIMTGLGAWLWGSQAGDDAGFGGAVKSNQKLIEHVQPKIKTYETKLVNGVYQSAGAKSNVLKELLEAAKGSNAYKTAAHQASKIKIPRVTPKSVGKFGARLTIVGAATMFASESFANVYSARKLREAEAPLSAYKALAGSEISYAGSSIGMASSALNLYGLVTKNSTMGTVGMMGWVGGMVISSIGQKMVQDAAKPVKKIVGHHSGPANKRTEKTIGSDFTAGHSYEPKPGSPGYRESLGDNFYDKVFGSKAVDETPNVISISTTRKSRQAPRVMANKSGIVNRTLHNSKIGSKAGTATTKAAAMIKNVVKNIPK